jgi:hypothetical protein
MVEITSLEHAVWYPARARQLPAQSKWPTLRYPPDKQEKATETVLEQAALLSAEWAA